MTFTEETIIGVLFRFVSDREERTLQVTKYHKDGSKDLIERINCKVTNHYEKDTSWRGLKVTSRIVIVHAPTEISIQLYPII